jgi:hypothetical protein
MSSRPNSTDALQSGDQFVIFKANSCDYRVLDQDTLIAWVAANIPSSGGAVSTNPVVQYFNPVADFSIAVENYAEGTYLLMSPSTGITNGTVVLPDSAELVDKQIFMFFCSQQITNFTLDGNGAAIRGEPTAIAAESFFKLQFDKLSGAWNRVG